MHQEDDDEDFDDEEEEEVCPLGCDQALYEKVRGDQSKSSFVSSLFVCLII